MTHLSCQRWTVTPLFSPKFCFSVFGFLAFSLLVSFILTLGFWDSSFSFLPSLIAPSCFSFFLVTPTYEWSSSAYFCLNMVPQWPEAEQRPGLPRRPLGQCPHLYFQPWILQASDSHTQSFACFSPAQSAWHFRLPMPATALTFSPGCAPSDILIYVDSAPAIFLLKSLQWSLSPTKNSKLLNLAPWRILSLWLLNSLLCLPYVTAKLRNFSTPRLFRSRWTTPPLCLKCPLCLPPPGVISPMSLLPGCLPALRAWRTRGVLVISYRTLLAVFLHHLY